MKTNRKNRLRVVVYYRVGNIVDYRAGIEEQRRHVESLTSKHGLVIDETIIDVGTSTNRNRPGVQKVLRMARDKDMGTLLMTDIARWSKDALFARSSMIEMQQRGICIMACDEFCGFSESDKLTSHLKAWGK